MIGHGKQRVYVWRQVDTANIRTLVEDNVQKSGVLMSKAIVVLPPDGRGNQQIQGRNRRAPGQAAANLQPLGVLVEHRINDVDERFIGGEEPVTSAEQVT